MTQHLTPKAPDRLDDYRREEIAIRKAKQCLRWAPYNADPIDKALALIAAEANLRKWSRS